MLVHKIIFRADFAQNCYDVLDKPGRVLSIIDSMGENYWSELRDGNEEQAKVAINNSGNPVNFHKYFTFSYASLSFNIECAKGVEINSIYSLESFTTLFKCAQILLDEFGINKFRRCGLRIFSVGKVSNAESVHSLFPYMVSNSIAKVINSSLGVQKDYMLRVVGEHKNNIKYGLSFGPYADEEASRHFEKIYKAMPEKSDNNIIFDLDLYENDYYDRSKNLIHWTKPVLANAERSISAITNQVAEISGDNK